MHVSYHFPLGKGPRGGGEGGSPRSSYKISPDWKPPFRFNKKKTTCIMDPSPKTNLELIAERAARLPRGGGDNPSYVSYRYVLPQRVWFSALFGHK